MSLNTIAEVFSGSQFSGYSHGVTLSGASVTSNWADREGTLQSASSVHAYSTTLSGFRFLSFCALNASLCRLFVLFLRKRDHVGSLFLVVDRATVSLASLL